MFCSSNFSPLSCGYESVCLVLCYKILYEDRAAGQLIPDVSICSERILRIVFMGTL